jgi:UDP-3-O-[3-hydroxymyristoyl] glucosamine N-acyltransferase
MFLSLDEIAKNIGGSVIGDGSLSIKGINSLDQAGPGEISFYNDIRYKDSLANTKASAIIVSEEIGTFDGPQVVVNDPALAYTKVAHIFEPAVPRYNGISNDAYIHEKVTIGSDVSIYPAVYIDEGAQIGDNVIIFPGVYVGQNVEIGKGTVIYPNVTILRGSIIGKNVILNSGTVIGSDGFGFVQEDGVSIKTPQLGIVQIDDDVEIGANNCIDRAAFGKTWIKRGVKTDNMVQIAHNVVIGEHSIIVAQAGISGSVTIGRGVMMGGQVGIVDHLEIGDGAMIASQSGVVKSLPPGEIVSGSPAIPHRLNVKASALTAKLPKLNERLRKIEKAVNKLLSEGDAK